MVTFTTENVNSKPHAFFALGGEADACPIVARPPRPNIAVPDTCCEDCVKYHVIAEEGTITNPLYNDFYTSVYTRSTTGDTFTIVLQKFIGGIWTDIATLNGNAAYGTFYDFGDISTDTTGYKLDWFKVMDLDGVGNYRLFTTGTGVVAGEYITIPFCLKKASKWVMDGTVRFDWKMQGEQPDMQNYLLRSNYGAAGYDCMVRVYGRFGKMKIGYAPTDFEAVNGRFDRNKVDITPTYLFNSGRFYFLIHELLMFNAFPSNTLAVTDYNHINQYYDIVQLPVLVGSGYDPNYAFQNQLNFNVNIEFTSALWNLDRGGIKC